MIFFLIILYNMTASKICLCLLPFIEVSCTKCGKKFKRRPDMLRHERQCRNTGKKFTCELCGVYVSYRKDNLKRHKLVCLKRFSECAVKDSSFSNSSWVSNDVAAGDANIASSSNRIRSGNNASGSLSNNFSCSICSRPHGNLSHLIDHRRAHAMNVPPLTNDFASLHLSESAIGGRIRDYDLVAHEQTSDVQRFFQMSAALVRDLIRILSPTYILSGRMIARCRYAKVDDEGVVSEFPIFHPSLAQSMIDEGGEAWYESHTARIMQQIETFANRGSDLDLICIERVTLKLNLVDNSDGQGLFPLPRPLAVKQAVVNVDAASECFKYALLSILHYNDVSRHRRNIPCSYGQWVGELNFGDLDVNNIAISDVPKVETLNNLKINIHVWKGKVLTIRYNNRNVIAPKTVNVLLVEHNGLRHYCGITSLSRLYFNKDKNHARKVFCERCCRPFSSNRKSIRELKKTLEEHFQFCREGRLQIEALPKDKNYSYKYFAAEESPVLVCYSDIECYIDPTTKKHHPAMIGMYEVYHSHFTALRENAMMRNWHGEQCIEQYLKFLDKRVRELTRQIHALTDQPMIISRDEQRAFDNTTSCPKCKTAFSSGGKHRKVRDHCHITGRFRGALCHVCNSRLRLKRRFLPVVFHNFKGYDGHLICKQAIGEMKGWSLRVIPVTHEKYMSLVARVEVGKTRKGKAYYFDIVFLDSLQFLSSSLASLVANLDHLPITEHRLRARYPAISDSVIRRKGVYPYSYFDSLSRLDETCLPPIAAFKDDLSNRECSPEDYAHAQRAWQEFECRNFRMYTARYMNLDIYLLADVFEAFRELSLREDGLDPVHFVSLPGLSYTACFKRSGETIDLLQDIDMVRMFERGIRGGLTFVNQHQITAQLPEHFNNEDGDSENVDLSEDHNQEGRISFDELEELANTPEENRGPNNERVKRILDKLLKFLVYWDMNNLYGSALSQFLPCSEFSWLSEAMLKFFSIAQNILDLRDDGEWGYLFEVDLRYPPELHASTADFPLAPESDFIGEDMFSSFMKSYYSALCSQRNISCKYTPYRKLLLTQYDKERYVCHFSILKFYLEMGMQLVRVRSAIRFRQKRFVESYIRYNSERRAAALSAFVKDFYKLKNNSFFGKTMEDVRHRIDFKIVTNERQLDKYVNSPLFMDRDIFSEKVIGVHMFRSKVVLNKPIYIGQAVLDLSKLEMYRFFYYQIKRCPLIRQPVLVGGDTDSFFLALYTNRGVELKDIYEYFSDIFDSSNYPRDHPLYSTSNRARLGCFKDEAAGKVIEEMILLRPKMYSIKFLGEDASIKRAKGISRHLVASTSHQEYREAFSSMTETSYQMTILRSRLHTVETVTFRKRGLSAWEDKRCWLEANSSVPHGSHLSGVPPPKRRRFAVPPSGDTL